ncbi:hypothetical protein F3Y22_tig00110597pilonHSYRG01376 [Hibiscus syriacus]|uniref:Uncharacterized protein n=1 Tax=Hibiscus syriacus TaxID=106335 RepID=A0A6A3A7A7_HIBSY|nr:hypothetical protein F3Y22_tig00110597pilonHSYRG01376 [Hibiscus syriacus]
MKKTIAPCMLCLVLLLALFSPSLSQGTQYCPIEVTMDGPPCGENGKWDCLQLMIQRFGAASNPNTCSCTTLPNMRRTCDCIKLC